jgi:hypothetical protein
MDENAETRAKVPPSEQRSARPPGSPSAFAARRAEIDAAAEADARAAAAERAAEAERLVREAEGASPRATLAAAVAIAVLVVVSLWIVNELRKEGQMEDCLLAHRTNCAQIVIERNAR